jgi:hypothetical protein
MIIPEEGTTCLRDGGQRARERTRPAVSLNLTREFGDQKVFFI